MLKIIKQASKDTVIYGFSNVVIKLIGIILMPIYTNADYLSLNDYGVLAIFEVTEQLMVGVFGLNLFQGLNRWYWDNSLHSNKNRLFFNVFFATILITMIFSLFSLIFANQLSIVIVGQAGYSYLFKLLLISIVIEVINKIPLSLMRLQSKAGLYSLIIIVKLIVTILFIFLLVVKMKKGLEGIIEAYIYGKIVSTALILPFIKRNLTIDINWPDIKKIILYSFPLLVGLISAQLLNIIDRYALNYLAGLREVGVYSIGFRIANTVNLLFISSVQLALYPIMFQKINDPNNKRFYSKVLTYLSFITMMAILAISFFSEEILSLLTYEKEYLSALFIIPIICMAQYFVMMKNIAQFGLFIQQKTKYIGTYTGVAVFLNLVLNIGLIPYFGIIGASVATLVSEIVFFTMIYFKSQQYYFIPYEMKKITMIIILGIVLYFISLLSRDWGVFLSASFKGMLIILFPLILYLFNFYEDIEIKSIKELLHKAKNYIVKNS